MSSVRVTYSGLISFLVSFIGVITGTFFVIIVTRQLSPEDFGLWTLIGSLVSYVTIINPIVTYWTTRQIARGEDVGKSALSTSSLFSLGGSIAYVIIVIGISFTLDVDFSILLLSTLLVPVFFFETILNSITMGYKPQISSYGILAFESTKIPIGFLLVYHLEFGIIGVLVTTILSSLVKIVILVILTREKLGGTIKKNVIKFWLRLSWLTLYMSLFGFIRRLDVLFFSVITGSVSGLAYWGAATAATNLVSYSARISQGLYPKMIATGEKSFAEINLQRTLFFAIPILAATIVFAKPVLYILNPIYVDGFIIVIILGFRSLVAILMGFSFSIIESFEKIDIDKKATFKQFVDSKLFLVPTLNIIHSVIYVSAILIFFLIIGSGKSDVYQVTVWALIFFIVYIPFVIYSYIFINKHYQIKFPTKPILKFSSIATLSSTIIYYLTEHFLEYKESIYEFLPEFLPYIVLGGGIYFGISYLVDKDTRFFFNSIFIEIKKSIKL
jgi:O-antigen/teichoic acid export membrane protein